MAYTNLNGVKIAYALTGSYCTFESTIEQMERLAKMGAELVPIMSGKEGIF